MIWTASLRKKAVADINAAGGECYAMAGDVSNVVFIQSMVDKAVEIYGKITVAIANAGMTLFGDFLEYSPDSLQKVMNLNLAGSFFLAQATAKQIKKQGSGGSILFMSSVNGHQSNKSLVAYGMTKAGLEMLAKGLVSELSQYGVSVNTVAPGATLTERTKLELEDYEGAWGKVTPMGRPSHVADIANAVLFFVAPASRQITGQSLIVDGGWTAVSVAP